MFIPTAAQVSRFAASSGALVYITSPQSIPNSANTKLIWDTEVFDTDGYWALGQPTRLTIPNAGIYLVGADLSLSAGATDWDTLTVIIKVDDDFSIDYWGPSSKPTIDQVFSANVETVYQFTAGQIVEVQMFQSHTVPSTADVSGNFWIARQ